MQVFLVRLAWLLFDVCHKMVSEPHRIEYGAGRLVRELWESMR